MYMEIVIGHGIFPQTVDDSFRVRGKCKSQTQLVDFTQLEENDYRKQIWVMTMRFKDLYSTQVYVDIINEMKNFQQSALYQEM